LGADECGCTTLQLALPYCKERGCKGDGLSIDFGSHITTNVVWFFDFVNNLKAQFFKCKRSKNLQFWVFEIFGN
jgi:hypothetical protein